jgi:hypothetical protein
MTGNKIYQMEIKIRYCANLIFRDSWMILMAPLDALKKTFNLTCENKGYFPHLFNKKSNKFIMLESLPPMENYIPNAMKPEKRKAFIKWYETNKNTPFNLRDALPE